MKYFLYLCIAVTLFTFLSACKSSGELSQANVSEQPQPSTPPDDSQQVSKQNFDLFIKGNKLSYNGYNVLRLTKNIKPEDMDRSIKVSYAVVKKHGRTLAEFDGVYFGPGNATDFGLFPFLGGEQQQLAISQTIPRGGRHWIVELSSDFRILFDSFDYKLGREEFYVVDIDKDGIYEITLLLTAFWGFDKMSMAESPLPTIIFKYDKAARKYVPANPLFKDQILKAISERISKPYLDDDSNYLSNRLRVFLDYVYAGEKEKAWSYFDAEYNRPDKEEMKRKIKAALADEPVRKYIYGKGAI